ncbi:MAG: hypothetical protein JJU00_13610 [Opitutales bacterium]|nr:hypothetical protein [Opitutales bacterium]
MRYSVPILLCTLMLINGEAPVSTVHAGQAPEAVRELVSSERARVQRLTRDISGAAETLNQGGIAPFQDPRHVQQWQDRIDRFRTDLGRFPQTDDPDVQAATAALADLENLFTFAAGEGARQRAETGDVQATLATIDAGLREHRAPQWLPAPFTDEEALRWVSTASTAKNFAENAIATIQQIAPDAHLPLTRGTVEQGAAYDRQDLSRLLNVSERTIRTVNESLQQTVANLRSAFEAQNRDLEYYRSLDPENPSHRMNAFLREDAPATVYGELDRQLAIAKSSAAFQRALGQEPTPNTVARIEEIIALRATYAENRLKAIGDSRLPEAKSDDPGRMAIAKQILAEPRYGFGEHGPVVLTTPEIVEREKEVSRAEIKNVEFSLSGDITLSGTETTWNYRWEEFSFATPVKETDGEDWYVWWITARKYASGWERTPIGRWVSGTAVKGDLIPPENFEP